MVEVLCGNGLLERREVTGLLHITRLREALSREQLT